MKIAQRYLRKILIFSFIFSTFLTQNSFAKKDAPLESVLTSMDKAAATFKTTQANFVWDQFTKAAKQTERQTGKVYFRRVQNEIQMKAEVTGPGPQDKKSVLWGESKFQSDTASAATNKNPVVENFLVLGFGGRGHDLVKSFDVSYAGSEKLNDIETEKINLVPKSAPVRNNFDHIILWIDVHRGISVQQQLIAKNEDYRLAKYSDIQVNPKIPDNTFILTTFLPPNLLAQKDATSLEQVLTSMDKAADSFKTTEADFVWDQFTKVVEQTETQKGKIYFRRVGNEIQMMADVTGPEEKDHKSVLFNDSKIQVYEPQLDQVTIHKIDKSFETYLMLGFGSRGHDLAKSFDVTYLGSEKLEGVETDKINLVPKSEKVKNTFDHIILWIDPSRGISVQQQLITPNEDYRLAKYSNIRFPQKLADNVFKLKTTGKTKFVTP